MNSRITISNELKELNSILPADLKEPVFNVPAGYFENFATRLLAKIKGEDFSTTNELENLSPLLAGMSRKMPYSVPENYFDAIAIGLPGMVADEQIPDVLSGLNKSIPYQVPVGYFDSLAARTLARVAEKQPAKVVSFKPRKLMRLAAAAIVIGVLAVGGIFYLNKGQSGTLTPGSEEWVSKNLNNISTEELEEFISITEANGSLAKNERNGKPEVQSLLKDIPNQEIEEFLEQVPINNDELLIN